MSAINDPIAAASSGPSEPVQEVQVDVTKLTALSPEVISKQATVCRFPTRGSVSYRDMFRKFGKRGNEGMCADESFAMGVNRSTLVPLVMSRTVNLQLSEPSREFRPLDSRTSWNEILPSSSVTPMPRYVVGLLVESKYMVVEGTRPDEGCVKDHRRKIIFTGGNVVVVAKAEPRCFSWLSSTQEL